MDKTNDVSRQETLGERKLPRVPDDVSTPQRVTHFLRTVTPGVWHNDIASAIVPWLCDVCPSPKSRRSYLGDLSSFFSKLFEQGIAPFDATGDDVRLYKESLSQAGYKKSSIARVLSVIRGVYEQFGKKNLVAWDTVHDIQAVTSPRVEKNTTPCLSEREAKKLLHAPDITTLLGKRDHALLFTYFKTACRSSAISYATVGDLERTDSDWYITVTEKRQKTQRKALLEATTSILDWLQASGISLDEKDAPLFPAMQADGRTPSRRHLTGRQILNIVKKYAMKVGIQVQRGGNRAVGTHSLRKTALTNALQHGAKMEQVQSLAGHADIRTTQLYYEKGEKDAENAARHIQIR